MKIGIYGRVLHDKDTEYVSFLIHYLLEKGIDLGVYEPYYEQITAKITLPHALEVFDTCSDIVKAKPDFLFSIGGDGTLLNSILLNHTGIPIMGINVGRLGFLTSSQATNDIKTAISALEENSFLIDQRTLIHLESEPQLFGEHQFAMNEFSIQKQDASAMVTIHVYVDGLFLNSYWADGLIVATPTGSTAYSLSCGGPIIYPSSQTFIITPISPHNLNVRPIVVPDDKVISFEIEGRSESFVCTMDSRVTLIDSKTKMKVYKESFSIPLVRFPNDSFFSTIRNKLMWGQDFRNRR